MKRIIFLNRFFFPDHSATSQILGDLAFHLARGDMDVHVISSRQRYDDPRAELLTWEKVQNVTVHRVASSRFGRAALLGRALDYLTFYVSMMRTLARLARQDDIIVAKTDPPMLSIPALWIARKRGARLVNWLQDIYPEIAAELGVRLLKGPVARMVARMRDRSLAHAAANVVVGTRMREFLVTRGIPSAKVHVIPNWCDDQDIVPVPHSDNPLRREWKLQNKFVIGYSGNLGRAHEFETVLTAAEELRGKSNVVFLMTGGGHQFEQLSEQVKKRNLDALFHFTPYQGRENLKYSLAAADIHWLSLRPELEGLIVPSKVYGIAAAGRPMLAVTAYDGEVARLIADHGCGVVITPGDGHSFATVAMDLAMRPEAASEMGKRARLMVEGGYSKNWGLDRWVKLCAGM